MQFADRAWRERTEPSQQRDNEETLRRDLRLALEQNQQADRLVMILTKRCDALRLAVLTQRKEFDDKLRSMEEKMKKDEIRLNSKLTESKERNIELEKQIKEQKELCAEYKRVAEAAIREAVEAISEMNEDNQ